MKHLILTLALLLAFSVHGGAQTLDEAKKLHELGRKSLIEGDIKASRAYTKQALEMRKILLGEVSEDYITSLNNYAYTFAMEKDYAKAIEYQEQVMTLCDKLTKQHKNYGMYAFNMGRLYFIVDNYEGASKYLEKALPNVEKFSEPYENILKWLGIIYIERNDVKNQEHIMVLADEYNAHELSKDCNDLKCLLERAEYYASKGATAEARECYLNVLGMSLDKKQKTQVYKSYVGFLLQTKDYKSAAEYEIALASLTSELEGKKETYAQQRYMAGLYAHLGKMYQLAIDNLDEALAYFSKEKSLKAQKKAADCNKAKGNAYSALKDWTKAVVAYRACVNYYEENDVKDNDYPKAILRLAVAEKFNKEYEVSIIHHKQAMALFEEKSMSQEYTDAESSLKLCYAYAGKKLPEDLIDSKEQVAFKEETIKGQNQKLERIISEETSMLSMTKKYLGQLSYARSLATIAGSYSLMEKYDSAVAYYKLYISNVREAIMGEFRMQSEKERMLMWKDELDNVRSIQELLLFMPRQYSSLYGDLSAVAYDTELLSKGILLNSSIEFEKILAQRGDKKLNALYADIKNRRKEVLLLRRNAKSKADFEKILMLEQANERLELQLYKACTEFADYTNYLSYDWKDVQKHLTPSDIAIEFVAVRPNAFDTDNQMMALVLTSDMKHPISIPICTIAEAINMIEDTLLYDNRQNYIWEKLKEYVDNKQRVFFSADGIFNQVAIEYLAYNGRPFSEQKQVYRLSTTKVLCYHHQSQKVNRAILFGDIDYNEVGTYSKEVKRSLSAMRSANTDDYIFDDLANTGKEIDGINSTLEKGNVKNIGVLRNVEASKKAFLSLSNTGVNIIHLATHGSYWGDKKSSEEESMNKSVLAFSGANVDTCGIVTASEVSHMNLRACDMVVLSACDTGRGKLGSDGVFGLQRGFKNAGVYTLLISLKSVYDDATALLMLEFYKGVMNGESKIEALVKAQQVLKENGYKDAKYWTPFVLLDAF